MAPVDSREDVLSGIYGCYGCETLPANMTLTQCWSNAGPPSVTLAQHQINTVSAHRFCWAAFNPVNTKHLYNVVKRCTNVIQMFCVWYCLQLTAGRDYNIDPMSVKCWASVACAGQYPFCPSQYFILPHLHAGGIAWA